MSRKKLVVPIEDQIIDYFMTAPRESIEGQLRAINRIVLNRFPVAVDVKGNGKGAVKPVKAVKAALGNRLGKMQTGDNVPEGSVLGDGPSADSNS